ncbi:hypothetical protein BC937DRAFT_94302 [Endogone sp. FLAS-F59071]|nr:hypothetical protein BC937DRAFT_94302 [Endogone sp. FLAS-F59071]|eukprot:RUS20821.1 hypothetical protein BC937DRAFT_94302 [Endogone sp. FLAS-F59071]
MQAQPLATSSSRSTSPSPSRYTSVVSGSLRSDGFVQTHRSSSSSLTQSNLSRHSIHLDDGVDRYTRLDMKMEQYHASVRNAASFDLSGSDEIPLPKKKSKRSTKKEFKGDVDFVLSPPRPLAFPFHNDSLFLPVVETDPAKQTQLGPKPKRSADHGTLRSSAHGSVRTARTSGSAPTHGTVRSLQSLFKHKGADENLSSSTSRSDMLKRTWSFTTDRSNRSASILRPNRQAETQHPIRRIQTANNKPLPSVPVPRRVSHDDDSQQQSDNIIVKLWRLLKPTNKQSKKQSAWPGHKASLRVL